MKRPNTIQQRIEMLDYMCNGSMPHDGLPDEEVDYLHSDNNEPTTNTANRRTTKSLSSVYESVRSQKKELLTDRIVQYQSKGWISQYEYKKYTTILNNKNNHINDENNIKDDDVHNNIGNLNPYRELELELDLLEDRYTNSSNHNNDDSSNNNASTKIRTISTTTMIHPPPPRRASKGLTPKGSGIGGQHHHHHPTGSTFSRNQVHHQHHCTTTSSKALLSPPMMMRLQSTTGSRPVGKATATGRFVSSNNRTIDAPSASTKLAVATNRVVHELTSGLPYGGIPSIVDPSDLSNVLSPTQISELFVEMCFFARLGLVQPPCCLHCAYHGAITGSSSSFSSPPGLKSTVTSKTMDCKRWVIWRKDGKKPYHPDECFRTPNSTTPYCTSSSSNVVVLQCKVVRKLIAGEIVGNGWKWDTVHKMLIVPPRRRSYTNTATTTTTNKVNNMNINTKNVYSTATTR
jgi:hypothetical protein